MSSEEEQDVTNKNKSESDTESSSSCYSRNTFEEATSFEELLSQPLSIHQISQIFAVLNENRFLDFSLTHLSFEIQQKLSQARLCWFSNDARSCSSSFSSTRANSTTHCCYLRNTIDIAKVQKFTDLDPQTKRLDSKNSRKRQRLAARDGGEPLYIDHHSFQYSVLFDNAALQSKGTERVNEPTLNTAAVSETSKMLDTWKIKK